jgi:hypothetical protein
MMPLSAMIGMTAGAGYFIDTYSLHQSHKFYGESAIQADAPPLVYGTTAYALGDATAGFLAASIWLRSQVSPADKGSSGSLKGITEDTVL